MKYILNILIIVTGLLLFQSCTNTVEPPDSMRLDYIITVKDKSDYTTKIFNTSLVESAQVYISSLAYGHYYSAYSDSNGQVILPQILPDIYNISVTRRLSSQQVGIATGVEVEGVLNGQLQGVNVQGEICSSTVFVEPVVLSKLVISEIYYNGSPKNPIPYYFHDQFLELYNNSNDTLYLDSLIVADVDYGHREEDLIYAIHAYMFPGNGTDYPLAPGELVIVAQDAINHSLANLSSIDLSHADFEYYVKDKGDVDVQGVTNMIMLHHKYGVDFLYSVFNNALVILKVDDPYALGYGNYEQLLLPKSAVLDGVDYRDNLTEMDNKRLDPSIDAGLTGGFDAYSGKSVERNIDHFKDGRPVLMDNNNSSIDFHVLNSPTPSYHSIDDSLTAGQVK